MPVPEHPRLATWKNWAALGVVGVVADLVSRHRPHWGYEDGEHPKYAACVLCHQQIRVDRLDLIDEHYAGNCGGDPPPPLPSVPGDPDYAPPAIGPRLTERQLEVLMLIAQGLHDREIATELGVSYATVQTHVKSLLGKLPASNRAHAAAQGLRLGLIP